MIAYVKCVTTGNSRQRILSRFASRFVVMTERPLERRAAALPDLTDGKRQHGERSENVEQRVAAVPRSSRRSVTRANVVVFPLLVVSTSSGMFTLRSKFPSSGGRLQSRSNRCGTPVFRSRRSRVSLAGLVLGSKHGIPFFPKA